MDIFNHTRTGIRPLDGVLAGVLVAVAVLIALENVTAGPDADVAHPLDSHSLWMIPVFALAVLPVLWRRRAVLAAIAASTLVMAASLPAFGWVTRCGFGLALSVALAYAVARFAGGRQEQLLGLAGIMALQLVTLVLDASTDGLGGLVVGVPLAALGYGAGVVVQARLRDRAGHGTARRHDVEHVAA